MRSRRLKETTLVREHRRKRNRAAKHQKWTSDLSIDINGKIKTLVTPKDAYEALKEVPRPEGLLKREDLLKRHEIRRALRARLQEFQNTRKRTNERRTLRMRKSRAWALLAEQERTLMLRQAMLDARSKQAEDVIDSSTGFCDECKKVHVNTYLFGEKLSHVTECPKIAKANFDTVLVYFEGKEGTCANSRHKGHDRWGGNKLGGMLSKSMLYVGVPEPFTSRTCSSCSHRVREAYRTVIKNGKAARVKVHGILECQNPMCIDVKRGRAMKKRDSESGIFILALLTVKAIVMVIKPISMILSDDHQPFRPFQHAQLENQTNNASQVLEKLNKLIPVQIDQDSTRDPLDINDKDHGLPERLPFDTNGDDSQAGCG